MKKEVIVAVILGLTLGLIVSYGVYRARKSLQQPTTETEATPQPSASAGTHTSLVMLSPEDESIQSAKEVKVTGTTVPNALIVIFINQNEHITNADASGNFSIQTELQPNSNVITTRSIDDDGNVAEDQRTVIMSSVSLDEAPTASYSATATPSATPKPPVRRKASPSPSSAP